MVDFDGKLVWKMLVNVPFVPWMRHGIEHIFSLEDERLELEPKITLNCEGKSSFEASTSMTLGSILNFPVWAICRQW